MIIIKFRQSVIIAVTIVILVIGSAGYFLSQNKEVTIIDNNKAVRVATFSNTVNDLLKSKKITLEPEDLVIPAKETKLKNKMKIEIKRAFPVKVISDNKELIVKTQPDTVKNILNKAKISMGDHDKVVPNLNELISSKNKIVVTRRDVKVTEELKPIPFETISRKDKTLPLGEVNVVQEGHEGKEKVITTIVYENGKPISKDSKKVLLKKPTPKIVLTGAMLVASRGELDYSRKLRMLATAYTHTGNPTATGTKTRIGVVAVDPKVIPLGSKLYIENYGFGRAEDTGGVIKGDRIDLFLETRSQALQFGKRWVNVYILK